MQIKNSPRLNHLTQLVLRFVGKRKFSLAAFFTVYHLFIAGAAAVLFYSLVPDDLRQNFINQKSQGINLAMVPANFLKGKTADPDKMYIDIKHKHVQRLAYVREISLQKRMLQESSYNKVPAVIRYGGESYRVSLSLKGRLPSHWRDDVWSFKVDVKDGKTIFGMKSFAIQHPRARGYIDEWLMHQFAASLGIVHLRYDFISVTINGGKDHIYALEEGFEKRLIEDNHRKEGPVFKFDRDFYWERGFEKESYVTGTSQSFWGSSIVPMPKKKILADTTQGQLFNKAKSLMDEFRQSKLSTSEVFDVSKLANYFALADLFGYHHCTYMDNIRFYYNPITSLVEPIQHDNGKIQVLEKSGLSGAEKQIGRHIVYSLPMDYFGNWRITAWHEAVFKDPVFFREYIKSLERLSDRAFLDDLMGKLEDEFQQKRKILHRDYSLYHLNPVPDLQHNQEYIKKALESDQLIQAYYQDYQSAKHELQVDVINIHQFPVEVLGAGIGTSVKLELAGQNEIIQANRKSEPVAVQSVRLRLPENLAWSDALMADVRIYCRILGSDRVVEAPLIGQVLYDGMPQAGDPAGQNANVEDFAFLEVLETPKRILIKPGIHQLDKDLIIPGGYRVFAKEGTRINMINGAGIFSYSPLEWIGSKDDPVLFTSPDASAQGIFVINAGSVSTLQHVYFDHLSAPAKSAGAPAASVLFFRSPVHLNDCFFGNNRNEGDCLRIVASDFFIDHTFFFNTHANAFDCAFSKGTIRNTRFVRSGNDAVCATRSSINVENILIDTAGGNGLSIGEQSLLNGRHAEIRNTDTGVMSSDLSNVFIEDIGIRNSRVAYAALLGKPEFGPAKIEVWKSSAGQTEIPYLIEDNCAILVSGKEMSTGHKIPN